MRSVALDLGVKETSFCEVSRGLVVARRTVSELRNLEDLLGPGSKRATVAIEACREAWFVHDVLTQWGHEVVLVDTTRTKRIGIRHHGRKTDRIDAELLARAVEQGGIPVAHVLSPARRELRDVLGVRRALVETRAQYITTIRGLARSRGERLGSCGAEDFLAKLAKTQLRPETRIIVEPLASALQRVCVELARTNQRLEDLARQEPTIERLTTAPGVGLVVAAAYVSVVDEARRFDGAHQLESYLGLVPREESTGGKRKLGAITKQGNGYMRQLLVQSASSILRVGDPDDPLRRWGRQLVARRGRKIAVVALARRLAGILWAMWRKGTVYEPARLGRRTVPEQDASVEALAMKNAARKARLQTRDTTRALRIAAAAARKEAYA
ncbi:MAG TPA: IS110 family transposase [Polyangiaceae bacterium]|nr:IS110 family transposase [Polyangiaceae bacterium]